MPCQLSYVTETKSGARRYSGVRLQQPVPL